VTSDRLNRRHLIGLGITTSLLGACALPDQLGRSERIPLEGGIGGTGIVGVVTDFSSLIVNGLKVETDNSTEFTDAFGRINARSLGLGDALTVEAETRFNRLYAKRVHVTHPLIGRVQAVAGSGARMMVNGVMIKVEPQARGRAGPGDRVRICGLWMSDVVVASQVELTNDPVDVMAGEITAKDGQLTICDVPISRGLFGLGLEVGQFATILGQYDGTNFNPSLIRPNRFVGAAGALTRLSVEGYLDQVNTKPGFALSGLGHKFADDLDLAPFSGRRALFEGPYDNRFEADRGLILPTNYLGRRSMLKNRAKGEKQIDWATI